MTDDGARSPGAIEAQGERILLVDDDPEDIASLGELVRLAGHAVDVAADGRRALAIVRSWHPDLVIMDLSLPDGDALKVIRSIKAETPGTAVFALGGPAEPPHRPAERARRNATAHASALRSATPTPRRVARRLRTRPGSVSAAPARVNRARVVRAPGLRRSRSRR